jgi:protein-tyrosine-phosphatase
VVSVIPVLAATIEAALEELERIPDDRRCALDRVARFVADRARDGRSARLTFICTHNSRRSQMAQVWAQTAAQHFGVPCVETYSGGTEASTFNPTAVAALERAGFRIDTSEEGGNPVSNVRSTDDMDPIECFSKVYDQPPNPRDDFCAVMTCSDADSECPFVLGAAERVSIPYDDPKEFDGTNRESDAYDERCRQIGREMLYLFSRVEF